MVGHELGDLHALHGHRDGTRGVLAGVIRRYEVELAEDIRRRQEQALEHDLTGLRIRDLDEPEVREIADELGQGPVGAPGIGLVQGLEGAARRGGELVNLGAVNRESVQCGAGRVAEPDVGALEVDASCGACSSCRK